MVQTPAERRAKRDEMARGRINPDTGMPFRNYNQLDTWQRNQKAKTKGFTSRAAERSRKELRGPVQGPKPVTSFGKEVTKAYKLPDSFNAFLAGRQPTERLAKEFNDAFNKQPKRLSSDTRFHRRALRARLSAFEGWDWQQWREEYAVTYG